MKHSVSGGAESGIFIIIVFSNQTQTIEKEMVAITDHKQTDFTCLESNEASFANVKLTPFHNKSMRLSVTI